MALSIVIGGSSTVIPGVYSTFSVASSIPTAIAPGRSVLILGESEEGIPGADLDLKLNYFEDFASVQDFYKAGAIVDAARQLFSNQPSNVFSGQINRLYIYKTNASTRAEKVISAPSGFGSIVAARYGERGNQIKSQIKTGQAESKPSKIFAYLPSPAARSFRVSVNGAVSPALSVATDGLASAFVTALTGISGLSATGGAARTTVVSGPITADLSSSGANDLILSRSAGAATFDSASIQAGDSVYIDAGLPVSGTADKNAGAYLVVSVSTTVLALKRVKSHDGSAEVNSVAFDLAAGVSVAASDLKINAPVTLAISATSLAGQGASLEILEDSASKLANGMIHRSADFANILVDSTSSVANISASVPSAGKLSISLSSGSWASIPRAGDLIKIEKGSLLQGATLKNVGLMIVESATSGNIVASHLFSGLTTEAISSVALNGANGALQVAASFVGSSLAARRIDSSAERKVKLEANRSSDGVAQPASLIGGNIALELSYYDVAATAATVTIDAQRIMTIDVTGTGLSDITVNTKKYATLQELADFLNSQAGVSAQIPDSRLKSANPNVLDMVSAVKCLSGQVLPAFNARLKKDYYDWKKYFADNMVIVSFKEGVMQLKAGLPDAEASAAYLTGGVIGATSNASVQAGLDEGLKITCRHVIPLFSRDASYDIDDGLTDSGSAYSIDSINAAVRSHVATASGTLFRKRRFGMVSWDGSLANALQKPGELAYERLQMFFERHNATNGEGTTTKFLPWMAACAVAAGRSQAVLGTSMLRKPFNLSSVDHIGQQSLYSDTLVQDFDPEDRAELEEAIAAGLVVLRAVPGFGVRMESPDLSTRSRENDPKGWFYERMNVQMIMDECLEACESVLENFIGERTSDVPAAVLRQAVKDILDTFVIGKGNGALLSYEVLDARIVGNQGKVKFKITPAEALESILLEATAERSV